MPPWLTELLQSMQRLQQDFSRQDSSIREVRSIVLENQHLLRTRLRNSLATLTQPTTSASSSAQAPTNSASRNSTRTSIAQANNAVRNEAFPIPRASRPSQGAVPRICWYHRQFGQTSTHCMEPCAFKAPAIPSTVSTVTVSNENRRLARRPAETMPNTQSASCVPATTNRIVIQRSFTTSQNQAADMPLSEPPEVVLPVPMEHQQVNTPSSYNTSTDWNTDQELEYPKLSDSSSSDSDSEDSQRPKRN